MRIIIALPILSVVLSLTEAFVPTSRGYVGQHITSLSSTVEVSGEEINARLAAAKDKMKIKDATSKAISKDVSVFWRFVASG